ncbi:UNVERIFIED_CONTAM: hypothetical protein HDU68_009217 [Siphonaria sp. JEL0065]|nr:hypothetical protein HDU68_009217 [Siphonaria sp. JEL0065]
MDGNRYLLTCIGTRGDVQPFVAIAQGLRSANANCTITLAAHEEYQAFVEGFGFGFAPLRPSITQVLKSNEAKEANAAGFLFKAKKMSTLMGPVFTSFLNDIRAAITNLNPTHLILSTQAIGCGAMLIADSNPTIKISILHVIPFVPTGLYAPALIGGTVSLGMSILNQMAWSAMMSMMASMTAPLENAAREKTGLRHAVDFYPQVANRHNMPIIHAYSQHLLPRPTDWPANSHVVGALVVSETAQEQLPADLDAFITQCTAKSPDTVIVYFGIGSMLGSLFDHDFATRAVNNVLDASKQVITVHPNVCVIIHTVLNSSESILLDIPTELSQSIYCLTKPAPHTVLFPRVSLVIHHGGAGTTHAALLAGRPGIILPCGLETDQPFWANVLVKSGFGTRGFEMKGITTLKFKNALDLALKELPHTSAKCKEFQAKALSEDAVTKFERTKRKSRGVRADAFDESDDDDDDDEDDQLRESSVVPIRGENDKTAPASPARRRGGKNEETLYSMDEELAIVAVLKFYNIKSFDVNDWNLDPLEIGVELMAALQVGGASDGSGPEVVGLPTTVRSRGMNARGGGGAGGTNMVSVKNIDATDPMGIKQSIFGNLEQSIERRAEVMKDLVKQHFAKFVNAKSTIDSFYEEMKTNNLISSETQGLAPYIKSLDEALAEVPESERTSTDTAPTNRTTTAPAITINAPNSVPNPTRSTTNTLLPEAYREVFQHVWREVENITENFRQKLCNDLRNPHQPLDVQERVLKYLVDLNPEQDPVWFYLNHRYETILGQLSESFETHLARMEGLKQSFTENMKAPSSSIPLPKPHYIGYLPSYGNEKSSGDFEYLAPKSQRNRQKSMVYGSLFSTLVSEGFEEYDLQAWKSTLKVVRNLCNILKAPHTEFRSPQTQTNTQSSTPTSKQKRRADVKKMFHRQTMIRHLVELYFEPLLPHVNAAFRTQETIYTCEFASSHADDIDESVSRAPDGVEQATDNIVGSPKVSVAVKETNVGASSSNSSSSSERKLNGGTASQQASGSSLYLNKQGTQIFTESMTMIAPPLTVAPSLKFHGLFLAGSHPLMACHWGTRIVKKLVHCYEEVRGFRVGGGTLIEERVLRCIGDAAGKVKKRCVEVVCEGLTLESRKFCEYEDFTFNIDYRDSALSKHLEMTLNLYDEDLTQDATQSIKLYYRFLKTVLTALHKISSAPVSSLLPPVTDSNSFQGLPAAQTALQIFGVHGDTADPVGSKQTAPISYHYETPPASTAVPYMVLNKVVETVSGGLCEFLDGLEWLATRWVSGNPYSLVSDSTASLIVWEESRLEELMLPPHKKFHGEGVGGLAGAVVGNGDNSSKKRIAGGGKVVVEKKGKVIDTRKTEPVVLCNLSYLRKNLMPKIIALLEFKFKCHIAGDVNIFVPTAMRYYVLGRGPCRTSQNLVKYVISSLLHSLALDLLRTFREIDQFSEMGGASPNVAKKEESVELVKEFLLKAKQATWMQLLCFRDDTIGYQLEEEKSDADDGGNLEVEEQDSVPKAQKRVSPAFRNLDGDNAGARMSGIDFARLSVAVPPARSAK